MSASMLRVQLSSSGLQDSGGGGRDSHADAGLAFRRRSLPVRAAACGRSGPDGWRRRDRVRQSRCDQAYARRVAEELMRCRQSKSTDDTSLSRSYGRMRQNTAPCCPNHAAVAASDDRNDAKAFPRFPGDSSWRRSGDGSFDRVGGRPRYSIHLTRNPGELEM